MYPDSQRLLASEEEKDGSLSDFVAEDVDEQHHQPKPQVQRWTTKFVLLQIALIALYTIVSAVVASIHIRRALSSHSTHFRRHSVEPMISLTILASSCSKAFNQLCSDDLPQSNQQPLRRKAYS